MMDNNRYFRQYDSLVALNPIQVSLGLSDCMDEISYDEFVLLLGNLHADTKLETVTRAQGKAALIKSGLWQTVIDFVNSIDDATEKAIAEVALNDTTHWQRSSPFLNSAAQALGLTDEQLDQLFIDASKIEL